MSSFGNHECNYITWNLSFFETDDIPIVASDTAIPEDGGDAPMNLLAKSKSKLPHMILSKISKRNSVVVINEEGDAETLATPPERKKSIDATAV